MPLSSSIDAGSLVYRGKLGDAEAYLADGAGPAAGMACLVLATPHLTRTACDSPGRVARSGVVLSEDEGPGMLRVRGYVPGADGLTGSGLVHVERELFEGLVPRTRRVVRVQRAGAPMELAVPGSR